MPRHKASKQPDNGDDVDLAVQVTTFQREELFALGWRGPTPSTAAQAEAVLQRLRAAPVGPDPGER